MILAAPRKRQRSVFADYAHDRPSPISRASQALRKGPRPSFSSRILKRRILPDARLRAVIRLRPVPVNPNLAEQAEARDHRMR